jgi:hypothetical protein
MISRASVRLIVRVLVPFVIGLSALCVIVYLFWPIYPMAGESTRRGACCTNLKMIGVALYNYRQHYRRFPASCTTDRDGRPMQSWRVSILPFLDDRDLEGLFDHMRPGEPWNSPHNRALVNSQMVWPYFHCPSDRHMNKRDSPDTTYDTSYVMVLDSPHGSGHPKGLPPAESAEGLSDRIVVIEVRNSGIHWAEPRDISLHEIGLHINDKNGKGIASYHKAGAFVLFGDGRVEFLSDTTDPKVLRKWLGLPEDGHAR